MTAQHAPFSGDAVHSFRTDKHVPSTGAARRNAADCPACSVYQPMDLKT